MRMFLKRIWRDLNPWYKLEVTHRGVERKIIVKEFKKKTPKLITGYDLNGEWFELRSDEPMDYYIEEFTDDLK